SSGGSSCARTSSRRRSRWNRSRTAAGRAARTGPRPGHARRAPAGGMPLGFFPPATVLPRTLERIVDPPGPNVKSRRNPRLPSDVVVIELSPRKREILRRVVEEYVATGQPVGSRALVEHSGLGVSSSTVRGELAELESLGLLTHPHTSA